ncbi:hypothetical protein VNO77_17530 [Canavalia gladiata]|uniref:Uncharacterized protein n=1 Tax=Canavalia gladiata TaxID=3824 RepID=A0AAN9LJC0_CANGL
MANGDVASAGGIAVLVLVSPKCDFDPPYSNFNNILTKFSGVSFFRLDFVDVKIRWHFVKSLMVHAVIALAWFQLKAFEVKGGVLVSKQLALASLLLTDINLIAIAIPVASFWELLPVFYVSTY